MATVNPRNFLHWTPRVLGTLFAALFLFFFLGDVITQPPWNEPALSAQDALGLALMGVTLVGLVLAWWFPITGGILSFFGVYVPVSKTVASGNPVWAAWPLFVLVFVGVLFIVDGILARRETRGKPVDDGARAA